MFITYRHKNSSYGNIFNSTIGGCFFHCPFFTDLCKLQRGTFWLFCVAIYNATVFVFILCGSIISDSLI
jgi:hypothetical protein